MAMAARAGRGRRMLAALVSTVSLGTLLVAKPPLASADASGGFTIPANRPGVHHHEGLPYQPDPYPCAHYTNHHFEAKGDGNATIAGRPFDKVVATVAMTNTGDVAYDASFKGTYQFRPAAGCEASDPVAGYQVRGWETTLRGTNSANNEAFTCTTANPNDAYFSRQFSDLEFGGFHVACTVLDPDGEVIDDDVGTVVYQLTFATLPTGFGGCDNPIAPTTCFSHGTVAFSTPSGSGGGGGIYGCTQTYTVTAPRDPNRATSFYMIYGDGTYETVPIPQGSGSATYSFTHRFPEAGNYRQIARIVETGGSSEIRTLVLDC